MGKQRIVLIIGAIVIAGIIFGSGMAVGAATNGAGSQNDPVVSKSYLDYRLSNLETGGSKGTSGYTKVTLSKGETYMPGEGSIMVIYSGNATVIGSEGLVNITEGSMFPKDCSTVLYNQFLVPSKNSGIKASSNLILYVCK